MNAERTDRARQFTAGAATLAAFFYAARSGQALVAGELDHMAHSVASGQPLVVAAAGVMAAALLGLRLSAPPDAEAMARRFSTALLVAAAGLVWVATARLIELLGVSGPWGLYSGPGFVAFVIGVAVAGHALAHAGSSGSAAETRAPAVLGRTLVTIALLHAAAGLVSMTVFNVLGRDLAANLAATRAGHALRLIEVLAWLTLAVLVLRPSGSRTATRSPAW